MIAKPEQVEAIRVHLTTATSGRTDARAIARATDYIFADVLLALESLFDAGVVELFTKENDDNVDVVVVPQSPDTPANGRSATKADRLPLRLIEETFAKGLTMDAACAEMGISAQSFYKRRDPETLVAIERGRSAARKAGLKVRATRAARARPDGGGDDSLIAARDRLFSRMKALTAQRAQIDTELIDTQEAHEAIVKLLRKH